MAAEKYEHVYQFKITLDDIKPVIWRRIQVPETYSFWDLHVAIQDVMGWLDYHLHEFKIVNPVTKIEDRIGIPDEEWDFDAVKVQAGWGLKIKDYFTDDTKIAKYTYDFGDNWRHSIVLEAIMPKKDYPCCLDGERACPPEDCGGEPGYYRFVEIMQDSKHKDHQSMKRWYGRPYKPDVFNHKLSFSDPAQRLKQLLAEIK